MNVVSLRPVQDSDLPIFFAHQLEPEAGLMAAFPARPHDLFMAHWMKVLADDTAFVRAILFQGDVAGSMVSWDHLPLTPEPSYRAGRKEHAGERRVGYWLGKEYWGKGIATAALVQFLEEVKTRSLHARVAKHNAASIRVLQKCGFTICGEDQFIGPGGEPGEEFILMLGASDHGKAE